MSNVRPVKRSALALDAHDESRRVASPSLISPSAHPAARLLELAEPRSRRPLARVFKRALDLLIAVPALVVLAPVLLLLGVMVKSTSPGPVLFRQTRFGLRLRPFTLLKLRTMVADAEERREEIIELNEAKGCIFKIWRDPRLTPIGHFLRRTSLDELPQLVNVLRGNMSLIGPRPLPDWVISEIPEIEERRHYRRFLVLPGMTGLWQVSGRVQDSRRMLEDDVVYVDTWSWWSDLRILAATPRAMLQDAGRRDPDA